MKKKTQEEAYSVSFGQTDISPYDERYPIILFRQGIISRISQAETIAGSVYRTVIKHTPEATMLCQALDKSFRLVVDAPKSTIDAIGKGMIKLTTGSDGKSFAQLREVNGRFGAKLPIKKESVQGIDPVQMASILQMKAMQEQLQGISDQLLLIDSSVRDILQGQQNDRIGLYFSGVSLYIEASNIADMDMQRILFAQSLRALVESTCQLTLTMQTDIQFLAEKKYAKVNGKQTEIISEKINEINQSFAVIHQASLMRAAIYCNLNEMSAMSAVLREYSYFIEHTVARNASLLAQCDPSDTGRKDGVWCSRAVLKLDVDEVIKKLCAPEKVIYLGIKEDSQDEA